MKRIKLPNGLEVFPVALGAMNFGTTTSESASFDVLDAYVDMGGNFIDTSNNYAHWAGTGDESELLLGKWLKERGCRDKIVLATKVGFDRHGEGAGLKKEQIEYWIDESLRKLNTDYIDIYYAHTDDMSTPIEETMEAFESLVNLDFHGFKADPGSFRRPGSVDFPLDSIAQGAYEFRSLCNKFNPLFIDIQIVLLSDSIQLVFHPVGRFV